MTALPIVRLHKVSKIFPGPDHPVRALDGIDLEVVQGDFVSIMGPSGSGKTTLLNIIGGIDRPSSGEVYVNGDRIDTLSEQKLLDIRRRKIAYVLQEARLLPSLNALENVMLPTAFVSGNERETRERATELLRRVGLGHRANHLVTQLSGGEAQRVCIARAMMNRPMLILADEPTGNLDHQTRLEIVHILESLTDEGVAVIMVTHDPEIGERADRRFHMYDGRLSEIVGNRSVRRARDDGNK